MSFAKMTLALVGAFLFQQAHHAGDTRPEAAFQVGERFPGIVLPSAEDGRPMSLVQFRGQKILLHIFASW